MIMVKNFLHHYKKTLLMPFLFFGAITHHTSQAQTSPTITAPHIIENEAPAVKAPYPDASLAPIQVKEAFKTALRTHRKILLEFGANWCPDCRMVAGVFTLPDASSWLEEHFVIVPINVERFNKNMEIAAQYGVHITAIPTILVITPQGKLLNQDGVTSLGHARTLSPQAVIDLIAQWYNRH